MIRLEDVDIVFGADRSSAVALLDEGLSNKEIRSRNGAIVGARAISLDVAAGEICVLMGLSGSGKSTVLRAVNGLNPVLRGRVLVGDGDDAVDVASCAPEALAQLRLGKVAMVFQQASLLPWRTVSSNIAFGLEVRGVDEKESAARVRDMLEMVNLSGWGDCLPHELSGGMQQRVGLARAFATDAGVLLMDEPYSALDPLIRQQLQDELLKLQEEVGKTVLFVSHDLDEALKLGDRIAIMRDGEIVQFGTPEEIVLSPADDYVSRFVAHINPLDVVKARSVMVPMPPSGAPADAPKLAAGATLRDAVAAIGAGGGVAVIGDGEGVVGSPEICQALAGGATPTQN